jgi:hypothetical protein
VLYSDVVVEEWARGAGATYRAIRSTHGHDAFLLEPAQVGMVLRDAVEDAPPRAAALSSHLLADASEPIAPRRPGGRRPACCAAR